MFGRILSNTKKQISRSGWTGWGSMLVMTLAFLIACIFGGLAYFSNLWIQYIESRSNLVVFYDVGFDQSIIDRMKSTWESNPKIKEITFTTEEEAYLEFGDYASRAQPIQYEALQTNTLINGKLPSSLDIQIYSLDDLKDIERTIRRDIESELIQLEIVDTDGDSQGIRYKFASDPEVPPITPKVDSERLDNLREVFTILRAAGLIVITLLFIVIFLFTLLTVEFRLYNQMEEIGVMQLVGGSLYFIRSPYILEGGFYGFIGSLLSSLFLGITFILVFVLNLSPTLTRYLFEYFSLARLPWPYISPLGWGGVIFAIAFIGFLIGSFSSYISIRRYIR